MCLVNTAIFVITSLQVFVRLVPEERARAFDARMADAAEIQIHRN